MARRLFTTNSANLSASTFQQIDDNTYNLTNAFTGHFPLSAATIYKPISGGSGTVTVDGFGLHIYTSPNATGVITVTLYNSTTSTAITSVTVNISVIYDSSNANNGFYFFNFGAGFALNFATTSYSIGLSSTGSIGVTYNTSSGSWDSFLRTTTTVGAGTFTSTDGIFCMGEYTGGSSFTTRSVNIDADYSISYFIVGKNGSWTNPATASITRTVTLTSASIRSILGAGSFTAGTIGTPIPLTSTLTYFWNSIAVDGGSGFDYFGGALSVVATNTRSFFYTRLSAPVSAAAPTFSVTSTVGGVWQTGDEVLLASTIRSATPATGLDKTTCSFSGTTCTVTGTALASAHFQDGTYNAHVWNMTRNITFKGTGTSLNMVFTQNSDTTCSNVLINWVSFQSCRVTTGNLSSSGSVNIQYCVFRDTLIGTVFSHAAYMINNITANNLMYNCANGASFSNSGGGNATTPGNCTNLHAVGMSNLGLSINQEGQDYTGAVSNANGAIASFSMNTQGYMNPVLNNWEMYSNAGAVSFNSIEAQYTNTINNWLCWRNTISAVVLLVKADGLIFTNMTCKGNSAGAFTFTNANGCTFVNLTTVYDAGFTNTSNLVLNGDCINIFFEGCTFGQTSTGNDLANNGTAGNYIDMVFRACSFTNAAFMTTAVQNNLSYNTNIKFEKNLPVDVATGNNKFAFKAWGKTAIDTTIFDVVPSVRMTPNSATKKFQSPSFLLPVLSGTTATVSVKIRKSVIGDGAAYNGASPRVFIAQNYAMGVTTDNLVGTASGAAGSFQTITFTTPAASDNGTFEVYVDCDGTAGWINVDTWAQGIAVTNDMANWWDGNPFFGVQNTSITPNLNTVWQNGFPNIYLYSVPLNNTTGFWIMI